MYSTHLSSPQGTRCSLVDPAAIPHRSFPIRSTDRIDEGIGHPTALLMGQGGFINIHTSSLDGILTPAASRVILDSIGPSKPDPNAHSDAPPPPPMDRAGFLYHLPGQ